jgi:hypothetical protein
MRCGAKQRDNRAKTDGSKNELRTHALVFPLSVVDQFRATQIPRNSIQRNSTEHNSTQPNSTQRWAASLKVIFTRPAAMSSKAF